MVAESFSQIPSAGRTQTMTDRTAWTPEQFWEYVGGLAGEQEAGQMQDTLLHVGLSLVKTSDYTQLSEQTRDMQTRAIAAETRLVEAEGVIHDLLGNFKPFTSRPIGAPHSQARLEQESQVFAHKSATDWINASLSSACAKCGCDTKGEMAFVDNKILCHPCADAVSSPSTEGK